MSIEEFYEDAESRNRAAQLEAEIERLRAENAKLRQHIKEYGISHDGIEIENAKLRGGNDKLMHELLADRKRYETWSKEAEAEIAKLRELKTPATRQLLNITKAMLDHAEGECAKLQAALEAARRYISNGYQPPELMEQISAALNEETK